MTRSKPKKRVRKPIAYRSRYYAYGVSDRYACVYIRLGEAGSYCSSRWLTFKSAIKLHAWLTKYIAWAEQERKRVEKKK